MMNSIQINTTKYQFSHGRQPRGYGLWLFQIGEELVDFTGSFTNAKNAAIKYAAGCKIREITVMP